MMLDQAEKPKPTDEQVECLDKLTKTDDNLLVNALAGTGKTTTIEMMIEESPQEPQLYLAFNAAIVREAIKRMPSTCAPKTFNGLGHGVWGQFIGVKLTIDTKNPKIPGIMRELISCLKGDDKKEAWENFWEMVQAVGMAKHQGYIPDGKYPTPVTRLIDREGLEAKLETKFSPLCWAIIDNVLKTSIKLAFNGGIDFDDQIYMSALFGASFPRFPVVFVDEAQDLSPTNHAMLHKMAESRIIAVGDRWQSIYAFRGADTRSVDRLKERFKMTELPLSISFRCPEAVVRNVHWHVPHMRWFKEGGICKVLKTMDHSDIPDGATIICRNNAPLFKAAFALLSNQRSVKVAGSEIGPKIIALLKKIGNEKDTRDTLQLKIDSWRDGKLETANNATAVANITDTAECLKIFASWGADLFQAVAYAQEILKQDGTIFLTTGHKAKGQEWNVVYHLDPFLLKDDEQDKNLRYVIDTRSKQELYAVETRLIQWL